MVAASMAKLLLLLQQQEQTSSIQLWLPRVMVAATMDGLFRSVVL
jgi:hypothetical protein